MNKHVTTLSVLSLFFIGLMIFSSCEPEVIDTSLEEQEIPEIPRGPSLMFKDSVSILSGPSGQVRPDSTFKLILEAQKGDSLLVSLEILLNGQPLPTTDFTVNGETPASNFFDLMGEEQNEFVWEIEIRAINEFTRVIYEFQLVAEDNRTDGVAITINTTLSETTPPNIELLNNVGDSTIFANRFARFNVLVDALGTEIDNIAVFRGANIVGLEDLQLDSLPFDSNPLPLVGDDRKFFEREIGIKANQTGPVQNTLVLTDALGVEYTLELNFINQ